LILRNDCRRNANPILIATAAAVLLMAAHVPASAQDAAARKPAARVQSETSDHKPVSSLLPQIIVDGGFEAGIPNPNWTETSTNFGTPLCDVPSCNTGGGTAPPRTGSFWAWFGGIGAPETATLGQTVTIPTGVTATFTFWLRIGSVSSPFTDVLNVRVDGAIVQSYVEPPVAVGAYTQRTIDMTAFADGAAHTILFEYIGPTTGIGNFTVDDVELNTIVAATVAPVSLAVDPAGNNVLQPNEAAVVVAPTWRNTSTAAIPSLTGTRAMFSGPAGGTYTIVDSAANYGALAAGASASCGVDCYSVTVAAATRPATHWDTTVIETVSVGPSNKTWTLHVGDSFTDVLTTSPFYRFIETILHKGVTGGCTLTTYCPTASTSREQIAVFALTAKEPIGYVPPPCVAGSEQFADVPASSGFCRWIEELFDRGVISGCGGNNFCPTTPITRQEMAVIVLRTLDPTLTPPACVAGSELFADVPASSPFCRWIEELADRGVVTGCGGGNYCPTSPVSREQMGVFLAVGFSLVLYGL
jgi:hypothetical protein